MFSLKNFILSQFSLLSTAKLYRSALDKRNQSLLCQWVLFTLKLPHGGWVSSCPGHQIDTLELELRNWNFSPRLFLLVKGPWKEELRT